MRSTREEAHDSSIPPKTVPTGTAGEELFAYVPRSAYGNLGNVTQRVRVAVYADRGRDTGDT